jgi:hypothetical protein
MVSPRASRTTKSQLPGGARSGGLIVLGGEDDHGVPDRTYATAPVATGQLYNAGDGLPAPRLSPPAVWPGDPDRVLNHAPWSFVDIHAILRPDARLKILE